MCESNDEVTNIGSCVIEIYRFRPDSIAVASSSTANECNDITVNNPVKFAC